VPEVGQSEQTQREEVGGLWDTGVYGQCQQEWMIRNSPTKGDMGCVCQKGRQR
jgi:hypothetical protein